MSKKKWTRPILIVLVRRSKEETVLIDCKYGSGSMAGAGGACTQTFNIECEGCG
jgi:hypothetical protein